MGPRPHRILVWLLRPVGLGLEGVGGGNRRGKTYKIGHFSFFGGNIAIGGVMIQITQNPIRKSRRDRLQIALGILTSLRIFRSQFLAVVI